VEDYDGLGDPAEFVFSGLFVWAQIHGIPELYRKEEVVDDLARRIGKVKEVQMVPKLFFEGNYVRLRVRIEVAKPLLRFVSLTTPEGKKRLAVKYEKMPFFCKRCGLIGHDHEECGDGVWEEKQLQYGTWMLATRRANQPMPAPRQSMDRARFRGGFAGRGMANSANGRKRNSEEAALTEEDDEKDTASSPEKLPLIDDSTKNNAESDARKMLELGGVVPVDGVEKMDTSGGSEAAPVPPPPPAYIKNKDKKQRKENVIGNNLAPSAASLEEDRRA
jgi:hypothetical protein